MGTDTIHNPGALKQTNKLHKHGKHKSNREIDRLAKGRVSLKLSSKRNNRLQRKEERRLQTNQIRKNKRQDALARKREIGGEYTAPFLTCILPLHENIDIKSALAILEGCDEDSTVYKNMNNISYLTVPRFRQRFSFISASLDHGNEFRTLDTMKVCDSTIILLSATADEDEIIDNVGAKILNMAISQGLPTPIVCLMDLESIAPKKRGQLKVAVQKTISSVLPDERLMTLDTNTDGLNLLRRIGSQKRKELHNRSNRPHLFGDSVNYSSESSTLHVTGFLRGTPLSVNQLVHIPGLGDFQMNQVNALEDPYKLRKLDNEINPSEKRVLAVADPNEQTSLQKVNIPDEMDAEQTWPTEDEIAASSEENKKKLIKRVPKGMSEYQACWIPDIEEVSENESDDEDENDDEDDCMSNNSDDEKIDDEGSDSEEEEGEYDEVYSSDAPMTAERYDKEMDLEEDRKTLEKIKAAKSDEIFPDEIDTPADVPARIRFQKYRGLESFRTSLWDVKENLPIDYAKIFQFENFDRTKRRIIKEAKEIDSSVLPGWYIEILIKDVSCNLWEAYKTANNADRVIVYGLLPHEHQMSVMNASLKRTPNSTIPIQSKENLIIQCGYRRFIVSPIYSQHTNGDKHKYERFFRTGTTVVATFFAPVQFPPSPILCFRQNPDTSLSMVATGSILSCNPDRVVLKRAVLSGHPFKIHRKSATIRYMFFNPDDIEYFKPCKLRTKCGRLGHIKESLGTHGHMKCIFDGQLKSHDTVLLYLYKRVFPKWNYEECIVSCESEKDTKMQE